MSKPLFYMGFLTLTFIILTKGFCYSRSTRLLKVTFLGRLSMLRLFSYAFLLRFLAAFVMSISFVYAAKPEASAPPEMLVHEGKTVKVPEASPYRKRIQMDVAKQESGAHSMTLPGVVEADPANTVNVLPPLTGRFIDLPVRLGDTVQAGQVLARIQSADLLQAGSDASKARDVYELATKARARALEVNKAGGNAQKDVEAAESTLVQAKAELDRAVNRLKGLGVAENVESARLSVPVMAPISGTVTALNVGTGSVINDPTAALMTITNLDQVFLTAQVPEHALSKISVGQALLATPAAFPDRPLRATVKSIASNLDPDTRRTRVRARINNSGGWLRPNMFVTIQFDVAQPSQVIIPNSAVVMTNDVTLVFVEIKPWQFEARSVELGSDEGERVRVRNGLKAGERIVVKGGVLLND
jgi:cobalt-zinc-cadmium efflux system membrane fusion protein